LPSVYFRYEDDEDVDEEEEDEEEEEEGRQGSPLEDSEPSNAGGVAPNNTNKSRSKICAICQTETDSFHLNYGASSCLSCR